MTISLEKDNEFTVLIADFIETLAGTGRFILKVWITGSEIPYVYTEKDNFHFMQEGFRVDDGERIDWFFYDTIASVRLHYGAIRKLVD